MHIEWTLITTSALHVRKAAASWHHYSSLNNGIAPNALAGAVLILWLQYSIVCAKHCTERKRREVVWMIKGRNMCTKKEKQGRKHLKGICSLHICCVRYSCLHMHSTRCSRFYTTYLLGGVLVTSSNHFDHLMHIKTTSKHGLTGTNCDTHQ